MGVNPAVAISPVLSVGLVNSDTRTGTVVYNWTGATSTVDNIRLEIVVTGYYTRNSSADFVPIDVYQPNGDFITGGGYITLTSASGLKAGDAGTKNNFGFNVKYNAGGTNLQGNINTIIRHRNGVLHVPGKGELHDIPERKHEQWYTSMSTALFNGKANIQEITNPTSPQSIDGMQHCRWLLQIKASLGQATR